LNLADTSIIDVSALLVAADSTNVSLTELIMNGVSLYDDVAETTSLFDPSILVSFSSISSLGLASLGLVDSDLLSIVHLPLVELNVAHNSLVDISPLYHLNGDLATLDVSYNSICLDGVDYDDDSALYVFFPGANASANPPSITSSSQDTSSCGFCSSSETAGDGADNGAGDPVIHCSDTSSATSLSSNTICHDGNDGVTTTTIYHEQWSVECNLYSYKVDNGDGSSLCVSYLDESDNYTPPDTFPTCVNSSMDNVNVECCSIDGVENSLNLGADTDFSMFTYLSILSVTNNTSFNISSITYLPVSLTYLNIIDDYDENLTTLIVDDVFLTNKQTLGSFSSLSALSVSNTGLTDDDLYHIVSISSLQTLDLSNNSLTDISLLFQLSELTSLDVSQNRRCGVTDEIFKPHWE
ncbi:hypothetical protein ADUPG1_008988, partial [Aduncisulcus paluster]